MKGKLISVFAAVVIVLTVVTIKLVPGNESSEPAVKDVSATQQTAAVKGTATNSSGSSEPGVSPDPTPTTAAAVNPPTRVLVARANATTTSAVQSPPTPQSPPLAAIREPPEPALCIESYSPCIPIGNMVLSCSDIGFVVTVKGDDPFNLDPDNDGIGCDSYARKPLPEVPVEYTFPKEPDCDSPTSSQCESVL